MKVFTVSTCFMMSYTNDDSVSHACVIYTLSEREAQTSSELVNKIDVSYLINANLPTCLEEVVDVTPASCHRQFRLQKILRSVYRYTKTCTSRNGEKILTTAGEGTCILATDRGLTWFAR